jgi:hypothetical protein
MKNTTGVKDPVCGRVRGGVMGCEAEFGTMVTIQERENQTARISPSQPELDFCPSQKKHFFCRIAKSLGCHFCAPK